MNYHDENNCNNHHFNYQNGNNYYNVNPMNFYQSQYFDNQNYFVKLENFQSYEKEEINESL